jgi:hypothetical protein
MLLAVVFVRHERPENAHRPAPASGRPLIAVSPIWPGPGLGAMSGMVDPDGPSGPVLTLPIAWTVLDAVATVACQRRVAA